MTFDCCSPLSLTAAKCKFGFEQNRLTVWLLGIQCLATTVLSMEFSISASLPTSWSQLSQVFSSRSLTEDIQGARRAGIYLLPQHYPHISRINEGGEHHYNDMK